MTSIIITTKNEERNLARLLKSIGNQTNKDFEIIVVDNYSTDSTVKIAKKYTRKVFSGGPERSAQRNFGLQKARGKYILILDADMELEKHVIKDCTRRIKDPKTAALVIEEDAKGDSFLSKVKALEKEIYKNTPIEAPRFFKKENLQKIGGWDESLVAGEDWDLAHRIKKTGTIGRTGARIYHWETNSLPTDLKKKYYYAQLVHRYAQKHPQTFKKQSSPKERLQILFQKPSLIFKNPISFFGLLCLKSLQYLIYALANSDAELKAKFYINQTKLIAYSTQKNVKTVVSAAKDKGVIFTLTKTIPQIIIFVSNHFAHKYFKNRTFNLNGQKYNYFYALYNFTYFGERCVEIPIIWKLLEKNRGKVLEIGNVLSHYFPITHDVLDKYEVAANVINRDIISFNPKKNYDLIVSISTLEHVGWDEKVKDPQKIIRAIAKIKTLLSKKGFAAVTLPIGYNPYLDKILASQRSKIFYKFYCLKRVSKDNTWKQVSFKKIQNAKFNSPYPFANAILIGIISNEFKAEIS